MKNLAEECTGFESNTAAHPDLLLEFAKALDSDIDAVRNGIQLPAGRRVT